MSFVERIKKVHNLLAHGRGKGKSVQKLVLIEKTPFDLGQESNQHSTSNLKEEKVNKESKWELMLFAFISKLWPPWDYFSFSKVNCHRKLFVSQFSVQSF